MTREIRIRVPDGFLAYNERIRVVLLVVARAYGYAESDIVGPVRLRTLSEARQIAYWLARNTIQPAPSYPELGRAFRRDHTTVMSGCERIASRMDADAVFFARVQSLRAALAPARKVRVVVDAVGVEVA